MLSFSPLSSLPPVNIPPPPQWKGSIVFVSPGACCDVIVCICDFSGVEFTVPAWAPVVWEKQEYFLKASQHTGLKHGCGNSFHSSGVSARCHLLTAYSYSSKYRIYLWKAQLWILLFSFFFVLIWRSYEQRSPRETPGSGSFAQLGSIEWKYKWWNCYDIMFWFGSLSGDLDKAKFVLYAPSIFMYHQWSGHDNERRKQHQQRPLSVLFSSFWRTYREPVSFGAHYKKLWHHKQQLE